MCRFSSPAAVLAIAALLLPSCATSNEAVVAPSPLDDLINDTAGDRVQVSVLVRSLKDGRTLHSRRPRLLMRPGSTMKLLTTISVALRKPRLDVRTGLQLSAESGGILRVVGGGDPMLSSQDLATLVATLHRGGARGITEICYDDPMAGRPRFGQGWMWDDEPGAYMPHLSGLTVDGGCVSVVARNGPDGMRVAIAPESDHTPVTVKPSKERLLITRDWRAGGATILVTGDLAADEERRRTISVPDSARHTAEVLKSLVEAAGLGTSIKVSASKDAPSSPAHTLELVRSPADLLAHANKPSDNLTAEMLVRHLGTAPGQRLGTAADGHRVVAEVLTSLGIPETDYRLADGSGVSHYNLVSADLLVRLLTKAWDAGPTTRDLVRDSLAIAGQDGTLSNRMRNTPAAGVVRAKTGTISAVSTIAGYAETASGEPIVFAIMTQNFTGSARPWRDLQDRILIHLVSH